MKKYKINEVFGSIQGEGHLVGSYAVFVRFSGCNLECTKQSHGFDCDTDHDCFVEMTIDEIENWIDLIILPPGGLIILTGGEPLLQVDDVLFGRLKDRNWRVAVETNGTIPVRFSFDWLTVSPKRGSVIRQKKADEVKIVLGKDQSNWDFGIEANHYFVSPAFDGDDLDCDVLNWCIAQVQDTPGWRLGVQTHKLLGIK